MCVCVFFLFQLLQLCAFQVLICTRVYSPPSRPCAAIAWGCPQPLKRRSNQGQSAVSVAGTTQKQAPVYPGSGF